MNTKKAVNDILTKIERTIQKNKDHKSRFNIQVRKCYMS